MSGQPSYTETIKLELQLADIQSQLTQRTAELEAAKVVSKEYMKKTDPIFDGAESLSDQVADLQAELERVRALIDKLDKMTPKRPCAITWEKGVEILNYVQDDLLVNYRQHRQGMEG